MIICGTFAKQDAGMNENPKAAPQEVFI